MKELSIKTSLYVRGLELRVFLGWPKNERLEEQTVLLDMTIHFPKPPHACVTDNLEDTYCYSLLSADIQEKIESKTFHLIEHLSCEIYNIVKLILPPHSKINVKITKHPHIAGLTNGICFSYGDGE